MTKSTLIQDVKKNHTTTIKTRQVCSHNVNQRKHVLVMSRLALLQRGGCLGCPLLSGFLPLQIYTGPSFQTTGFRITLIHELSWGVQLTLLHCAPQHQVTCTKNRGLAPLLFNPLNSCLRFLSSSSFWSCSCRGLGKGFGVERAPTLHCQHRECGSVQPKMVQKKWGQRRHSGLMRRSHLKVAQGLKISGPEIKTLVWLFHFSQHHDLSLKVMS